ncbi:uncharacterized protein [Diadema setosum]|uniref:uncharacterized protein n=1 Tax=Diadema setosum TaxID=31175 RepID=UPI003B3B8A72
MNNSSVKRKHPDKSSDRLPGNKRRCEKQSSYIEELYELITASLRNPASLNMKPDKCALIQETLSQIKLIKQQQDAEHGEEVQHSHVSSSKPGVPTGDSLGSVLLETLDGFLFVVNSQGEIEYVTENVNSYLNFQQEELIGSSIYSFVHVGDHHPFIKCLLPSTTPTSSIWPQDAGNTLQCGRNRSFKCRMQVKPENEDTPSKECYTTMMCSAILKPAINKESNTSNNDAESTVHLFCIARRASPEEHSAITENVEEFTTKLSQDYVITSADMSRVKAPCYTSDDMVGQTIFKFCHGGFRSELKKHIDEEMEYEGNKSCSSNRLSSNNSNNNVCYNKQQQWDSQGYGDFSSANNIVPPNVSIQPQKSKMMFPNQMSHPIGGGPGMQHPIGGAPQQYSHRSPGTDYRPPPFSPMMPPQGQHMGYQGGQNYPQDFGGMGVMGNMMPPGQGSMGMNPNQHQGMGGMRPTGINPNIPRPNMSQGHGMTSMGMKHHMLSRSLSVPQQMTPGMEGDGQYGQSFQPQLQRANSMGMPASMGPMQGGGMPAAGGQMPVTAGGGKPSNMRWAAGQMNPNQTGSGAQAMGPGGMGMNQGMGGATMSQGMGQTMGQGAMGPDVFSGGMQPMPSASMELTNTARNRRTPVSNMATSQAGMRPGLPVPTSIPTPANLPSLASMSYNNNNTATPPTSTGPPNPQQHTAPGNQQQSLKSMSVTSTTTSSISASGPGGSQPNPMGGGAYSTPSSGPTGKLPVGGTGTNPAGGTSDLDMLGITMDLLDQTPYNKDDKTNSMDAAKNLQQGPTGNYGNQPDSTGPVRAGANPSFVENQARQEARARYQEFVEISNAKDAPDAATRASNLFRNQLRQRVSGNPGMPGGMNPGPPQGQGFPTPGDEMGGHDGEGKSSSLLQKLLLD